MNNNKNYTEEFFDDIDIEKKSPLDDDGIDYSVNPIDVVNFKLNMDDILCLNQFIFTGKRQNLLKMLVFCETILVICAIIIKSYSFIVPLIFFVVGGLLYYYYPNIATYSSKKLYESSYLLKNDIEIEFYDNHMVVKTLPNENTKHFGEKHYPYEAVLVAMETEKHILFFVSKRQAIILPLRVFDTKSIGRVYIVLEHYLSERYLPRKSTNNI